MKSQGDNGVAAPSSCPFLQRETFDKVERASRIQWGGPPCPPIVAIFPPLSFEMYARPRTVARLSAGTAARPTEFLMLLILSTSGRGPRAERIPSPLRHT